MIFIIILYILCAMTFTIAKATLAYASPLFFVGIRMSLAGLLLYGAYYLFQKQRRTIKRGDWWLFIQIMLFSIYFAYVFDLWSLQFITSIESSLIFNLSPFIAAFFSYFWFGEYMTPKKWLGLLLGALSIIPLFIANTTGVVIFDSTRMLPIAVLMLSVVSSTYGWIVMRELVKVRSYSPFLVNGVGMLGGGIGALMTSFAFESWSPSPVISWPHFLIFTLAIILVSNILFSNLYSYLLKHYTATLLSFAGFLCPLFATLFGWFFLHEPLSWRFFFSFIGVTAGLYLFYREELRQGYVQ